VFTSIKQWNPESEVITHS